MKYIIKNCPACRDYDVFGKDNEGCCYLYNDYCIKNNDCLLKQIVNKCQNVVEDETDPLYAIAQKKAQEILQMLDIESV